MFNFFFFLILYQVPEIRYEEVEGLTESKLEVKKL